MGCIQSTNKGGSVAAPPPNTVLPHYTLAALEGSDVCGPFLRLRSYDPVTGSHELSALVVCSEAALQRLNITSPRLKSWDSDASPTDVTTTAINAAAALTAAIPTRPLGGGQHETPGELLFSWRDWRFWRFRFGSVCGKVARKLRYQVDLIPGKTFAVALPARDQPWHWAYYSCNGLDNPGNAAKTGGVQPLWRDLMAKHSKQPLHALVGGGDQLYNDGVFEGPLLKGWDRTLSAAATEAKIELPFTAAMREEVEEFYFSHYCVHFSQPVLGAALASIPSINIWDDHDIFDGWGSYPDKLQQAAVMQGIFRAAQLFYHLFQLHTTEQLAQQDGFWMGTSSLTFLGAGMAVVLPDTRTFRTIRSICPPEFYEELRHRLEGLPQGVQHVVVVLTVPLLWPHINVQKLLQGLSSEITRNKPVNEILGLTGILRRLHLRFGAIDVIDDLIDHWDADQHRDERGRLLELLMHAASTKGFRVTVISGDVHCAGYSVCYPREDGMDMPRSDVLARDPRFITQVVSSAIANIPPPSIVIKATEAEGKSPKPVTQDCVMRMRVPGRQVHSRCEDKDDCVLAQRNWCEVAQPNGSDGEVVFSLRCEKKLGKGYGRSYDITVPPLQM